MHNRATIREITHAIGIEDQGDDIAVLMTADGKGVRFWTLDESGKWFPDQADALYVASGLFKKDAIKRRSGKSQENIARIIYLPWDADLLDFMGADAKGEQREAAAAALQAMEQDEIDALIYQLRTEVERAFAAVQIPIHRLDYTGYGLCGYTYIDPSDGVRIQDARAIHKIGIDLVNRYYGGRLIDPQTSDVGTRVTRLPYSENRKNPDKTRLVRTLIAYAGQTVPLPTIERAERARPPEPITIPYDGDGLSTDDASWIVQAIRPFWTLGQKHAISLALSGMLAKSGVPELQAESLIDTLSADDQTPGDRMKGLRRTYERARQGADMVAGYTTMRMLIDPSVLDGLDRILRRFAASFGANVSGLENLTELRAEPARIATNGHSEPSTLNEQIPAACMTGWLSEYVDLVEPLSEAAPSFHFACGLTLAGSTFGRSVANEYVSKPLYPNLYTMLIGNAGTSRKDTAIRFALDLPNRIPVQASKNQNVHTTPFTLATDVGSAEGMIKFLSENPNTLLYITEYKRLAQNAHRQSTATILSVLTAAWDTPITLDVTTKANPISARFPFLSILAAVQPGVLAQEMTPEDIESGYATRWLFVPGSGTEPRPDPPNIDDMDAFALYGRLLKMRERYQSMTNARVDLDAAARKRWIEWYEYDRTRPTSNDDEDSMRSRLGTQLRKVALIYAACEGADAITPVHLEPAIAFMEWAWTNTRIMLRGWGNSVGGQIEHRIMEVLTKSGPIRRSILHAKCKNRKWTTPQYSQTLESMIKESRIMVLPDGQLSLTRVNG